MTDREDDMIDLGDAVTETRGSALVGQQDTDRPLYFVIGLSDDD